MISLAAARPVEVSPSTWPAHVSKPRRITVLAAPFADGLLAKHVPALCAGRISRQREIQYNRFSSRGRAASAIRVAET
jgi:hypothetical protein